MKTDLTLHSSEQKTGSSELWRIFMTSRIVCCLATLGSNYVFSSTCEKPQRISKSTTEELKGEHKFISTNQIMFF